MIRLCNNISVRSYRLVYNDSKRNVTIRNVKVLAVGEQRFMAYCYTANEVRTFRVSGVVDVEPLNKRVLEVMQHVRRYQSQGAAHTV